MRNKIFPITFVFAIDACWSRKNDVLSIQNILIYDKDNKLFRQMRAQQKQNKTEKYIYNKE